MPVAASSMNSSCSPAQNAGWSKSWACTNVIPFSMSLPFLLVSGYSASAEWQPADAPPHLAKVGRLKVVEHDATRDHAGVAVEVEADTLDADRAEFLAEAEALALARQDCPVDRPEEALHDSRVFVAIDAHERDVEGGHGTSVHLANAEGVRLQTPQS